MKTTANEKDQQIKHMECLKSQLEMQFLQVRLLYTKLSIFSLA